MIEVVEAVNISISSERIYFDHVKQKEKEPY